MTLEDVFNPKKRRYLKGFIPRLNIRAHNSIRITGKVSGTIKREYRIKRHESGHPDYRDYLTDLAKRGLERIIINNENHEIVYDTRRIREYRDRVGYRTKFIKINLKIVDLRRINVIASSISGIDLYDCISYLIMIGQDEVNGGIRYDQEVSREKIYS